MNPTKRRGAPTGNQNAAKDTTKTYLSCRVLPPIKARAKALAKQQGCSLSEWCGRAMTKAVRNSKAAPKHDLENFIH